MLQEPRSEQQILTQERARVSDWPVGRHGPLLFLRQVGALLFLL